MAQDVMTPEERLVATINLEPVDRVCCAPMIGQYAGQFAGITNREFVWDWDKAMAAVDRLKEAYPIWDCNGCLIELRYGPVAKLAGSMRIKLPGEELSDNAEYQMVEAEIMTRGDYSIIKEQGITEYKLTFLERTHGVAREQVLAGMREMARLKKLSLAATYCRGQSALWGSHCGVLPFDGFSMMRSMGKFYKDMYQIGNELAEYLQIANESVINAAPKVVEATGVKRVFIGGMRGSGQFITKKYFDRFVWPYFKEMIEKISAMNIITILHLDADWNNNLEYFLELPQKSFVLQLDSATDIFKAKEILDGHCCLMGDVSPALLTIASPSEVDEYCKKLITVVGKNGGFIYSVGCATPLNAKHENMKAFFEAVEKYGRYN
ncbi:MAG TPA: uroporphyrinogen decarboxylase family protein [Negativicutes bacterium]